MSDAIDDAAWPPQLNIRRWLGNVAGFLARQARDPRRGRRSADPHPSESGDPCLRSVWQGSH